MPLAEVAGFVRTERLADRAPHPVGGHHVPGVDLQAVGHHGDMVVVFDETFEAVAVADVRALIACDAHQRVIELEPGGHRGVRARLGQRDEHLAAAR